MSGMDHCPVCGGSSRGTCRRCLLEHAFGDGFLELPGELGGFRLLRRVGRGASGEVWQAFQPGPDREVAIKVFLDPRLGGHADRPRFMAEAQALGRLDHPGIVPVFATGEDAGFLFIASRWMPGGTLAEQPGGRAAREVVATMAKVARAAAHAHRHGLVHRDIKPANVLLDAAGEPYLADFGIAMAAGLTESGSTSGTPAYMAPEQAGGGAVTTAADVFGLGAVMFDGLTGKPPPRDGSEPRGALAAVDADVAAICLKCLREEPDSRYVSAEDLAEDLERWLRGEPVRARPVGAATRLAKWMKRRPALAALATVAVLSALALAVILVTGSAALRKERNHAVAQEDVARKNAGRAERTAAEFREHAYAADIYLASRALEDGQLGVARAMLERHLPAAGEADLRGFEWHAYRARCGGDEVAAFHDHAAAVTAVAFSPDGRHLASAGRDGRVVVRELEARGIVLSLPAESAPRGAAEIPLMLKLTTASPEIRGEVLRGNLNPDEVRMRGRPSKLGELSALAWSPDGKRLATASMGSYVRLWSFPEGELVGILPPQQGRQLAFTADGRRLLTMAGWGDRSSLWMHDLGSMKTVWHREDLEPAFATDGDRLAFVRKDGTTMEIVDLVDMREVAEWPVDAGVSALAFSSDGERLAGLSPDGRSEWIRTVADGEKAPDVAIPGGAFRQMVAVGDGFALAGTEQSIALPDGAGSPLRGHEDEVTALAVSHDGRWLASGAKDRTVRLWRVPGGAAGDESLHDGGVAVVACGPDGRHWLGETADGRAFLGVTGGEIRPLGGDDRRRGVGFSRDGGKVATWREVEGALLLEWWSVADGEPLGEAMVAVKASKPWLVTGGSGRFAVTGPKSGVEIFGIADGLKTGELESPGVELLRMALSNDGRQVAAFVWPRQVKVGAVDGKWGGPWKLTDGTLGPMLFSPDGRWLVSGSDENRVAIHDAASGELLRSLSGHREPLTALAFTPDGRTLVSSSGDRTLRLWQVPTWRPLGVLERDTMMTFLAFDGAGESLFVAPWRRSPRRLPE